ncbi:MAG: hypothetical protein ACXWUG_04735 [Polyangiales bacterium]
MRFPLSFTNNLLLETFIKTFGVKRESSFAEIEGGNLHVKMGIWFEEKIPLDQILQVAPSEWPWWGGLGVKLHHHGVGVIGSTEGVVNVKFKQTVRVRAVVGVDVEQLWLSLDDRDGFIKALAEASHATVADHAPF